MNRREFTASLAALAASPAVPIPLSTATASQSASVPAGTYAWAQLIARAQNRCSPAMLARQLRLSTGAAQQLFNEMLRDGVIRAPGAAGIAQAAKPINGTGVQSPSLRDAVTNLMSSEDQRDEAPALVKDDSLPLECEKSFPEDQPHARETKSVQSSPEER